MHTLSAVYASLKLSKKLKKKAMSRNDVTEGRQQTTQAVSFMNTVICYVLL